MPKGAALQPKDYIGKLARGGFATVRSTSKGGLLLAGITNDSAATNASVATATRIAFCCPYCGPVQLARDPEWVSRGLDGVVNRMVALRRDIHAHPELAWHEVRTSASVTHELVQAGLAPTPLPGGTGLVCDIVGDGGGPMVALRADLDALPIDDEKTSRIARQSPASPTPAATTSTLWWCWAPESAWPGWRLPANCRAGFGWCSSPPRRFSPAAPWPLWPLVPWMERGGSSLCIAILASMRGRWRSGWARSPPRSTRSPCGSPAQVVTRRGPISPLTWLRPWPTSWSGPRRCYPGEWTRAGLSLVWGSVTAGSADNVIPQRGEAAGTVRVLDPSARAWAVELIPRLIEEIAAPYRAQVDIDYRRGVPPAVNDPGATEAFRAAAAALLGPVAVHETPQSWAPRISPGSSTACLA